MQFHTAAYTGSHNITCVLWYFRLTQYNMNHVKTSLSSSDRLTRISNVIFFLKKWAKNNANTLDMFIAVQTTLYCICGNIHHKPNKSGIRKPHNLNDCARNPYLDCPLPLKIAM